MAMDRRIPCLINIPCEYPDGSKIPPEKLNEFLEVLDRQFGGSTPLGVVSGRWLDPDESKTVIEPMLRVEVSVKESEVALFEKAARLIGKETKQKVMYVVINFQAQSQMLWVENDDDDHLTAGGGQ